MVWNNAILLLTKSIKCMRGWDETCFNCPIHFIYNLQTWEFNWRSWYQPMCMEDSVSSNPLMTVTSSPAGTPRNSTLFDGASLLFMRNGKSLNTASGINDADEDPRVTQFLSTIVYHVWYIYGIHKSSCSASMSWACWSNFVNHGLRSGTSGVKHRRSQQ